MNRSGYIFSFFAICTIFFISCTSIPGNKRPLTAAETGSVIAINYMTEKGFKGALLFDALEENTDVLLAETVLRPKSEGTVILQIPREAWTKNIQITARYITPNGTMNPLQSFPDIFYVDFGSVLLKNEYIKIHRSGTVEILFLDLDIFKEEKKEIISKLNKIDPNYKYFDISLSTIAAPVTQSNGIVTRNISGTSSYSPDEFNAFGMPLKVALDTFQKDLSYFHDKDNRAWFESLYTKIGKWVIINIDPKSLSKKKKDLIADVFWSEGDFSDRQASYIYFTFPLVLNEEMYQILKKSVKTKEQEQIFLKYKQYSLSDRFIYLYKGARFPRSSGLNLNEKKILSDFFYMLPSKYILTGASFSDEYVNGFSFYPEEDINGFSNSIYLGIIESLSEAGIPKEKFFSYYIPMEHEKSRVYDGKTHTRRVIYYYLKTNYYRLSDQDKKVLASWKSYKYKN